MGRRYPLPARLLIAQTFRARTAGESRPFFLCAPGMARSAVTGAVSAAVVAAVAAGPSGEGLNVECRTENGLSMVVTDADDGAETLRAHAESSGRKPRGQASGASNTTAGPPPSRPEADERSAAIGGTRPSRKFQGLNRLPFELAASILSNSSLMSTTCSAKRYRALDAWKATGQTDRQTDRDLFPLANLYDHRLGVCRKAVGR